MKIEFNMKKEPIWELETACAISTKFAKERKMTVENAENNGSNDEQMQINFEKHFEYYNSVLQELMPIFNTQYKKLEQFFEPNLIGNPIIMDFVLEYIMREYIDISDEEIDEIVLEILKNISNNFITNSEIKDFNFNDLVSVINMLNKTSIEDKYKMQVINFYNDRYNIARNIISLLKDGTVILKKHFKIIEEDFNKAVDILEKSENLYDLCSNVIGLKLPLGEVCDVYTLIFSYNELSIHSLFENYKSYLCFIGIYVFELYEKKRIWKMNDTKIIIDLKAIGDATRYKILFLLSKKQMYLQELADELNLTPATISHHTNVLLRSNLISIAMDLDGSKKIYYQINKEKINELCNLIKELAD